MTNNSNSNNDTLMGVISINAKGRGFVRIEGQEDDIMVDPQDISTALNRDTVAVSTFKNQYGEMQGKVLQVTERSKEQFVGTIISEKSIVGSGTASVFKLKTDDFKSNISITITNASDFDVCENIKAQVKIDFANWTEGRTPNGKIVKLFGDKGDNNAEMEAIVAERGFDTTFSNEVIKEAEESSKRLENISEDEIKARRDFRKIFTCTIDPADAKDFDDAISLQELSDGNLEIGVHIADVSHFVVDGTALDREARKRSLSVYLVDRTIPMLPSVLSNGVCSLNPNEDRLSFSAVFIMDKAGNVKDRWFGRTIIHSARRFTYEDAQERLSLNGVDDSEKKDSNGKPMDCVKELHTLNSIAKILTKHREIEGAIDFETTEIKFKLDETGRPIAVYKKERMDSHRLVEEFMLLANREVAKFIHSKYKNENGKQMAGVYRIHDVPNMERLEDLGIFVRALGYDFQPHKDMKSKDIQKLLHEISGSHAETIIKTATLRSMAKAAYATVNIGHFGLAFSYYTHFTSPIRRYADLMVHRILGSIGDGTKISQALMDSLEKICIDSSKREVEAADAERASIKYKQVEFMQNRVGQTLNVTISGIAEWGMFVEEEESKAEGLIRLKDLPNDFYSADTKNYVITGNRTKKKFSLGDKLKVKLMRADLDSRSLDFVIV